MRIHPFVLFTEYAEYAGNWLKMIYSASALTHAHPRSQIACGIYACVLHRLLRDPRKESIEIGLALAKAEHCRHPEFHHYKRIFDPEFRNLPNEEIKSTGYVVDTLEAALWCLLTTDRYKDCVLKAVNLGDDTDTVAAIAGGLAGALYSYDGIPEKWRNTLIKENEIEELCLRAYHDWKDGK